MEQVTHCEDCPLALPDLKSRVLADEFKNEYGDVIYTNYKERIYCGHYVKMVDPKDTACVFIKEYKK